MEEGDSGLPSFYQLGQGGLTGRSPKPGPEKKLKQKPLCNALPACTSSPGRGVCDTAQLPVPTSFLLQKTRRCPPTWPSPSASFCRPQPRVWLLWVDPGITTSATSVSPNNPNYQASSSPKDQTTELMCLIAEFLPLSQPEPRSAASLRRPVFSAVLGGRFPEWLSSVQSRSRV